MDTHHLFCDNFQIFVKIDLYTKNSISLQVTSTQTITELSEEVEQKTGVAAAFQKIVDPITLQSYSPLSTLAEIGIQPCQTVRIRTNKNWDESRKRTRFLHVFKAIKEVFPDFPECILKEIAIWDGYFFGIVQLPFEREMNLFDFHATKAIGA